MKFKSVVVLSMVFSGFLLVGCSKSYSPKSTAVTGIEFNWSSKDGIKYGQMSKNVESILKDTGTLSDNPKVKTFSWNSSDTSFQNSIIALDKDYPLPLEEIVEDNVDLSGKNFTYDFVVKGAAKNGSHIDLIFIDPSIRSIADTPAFVIAKNIGEAKFLKKYQALAGKKVKVCGSVSTYSVLVKNKSKTVGVSLNEASFVAQEKSADIDTIN